jgi:hypothetical protein
MKHALHTKVEAFSCSCAACGSCIASANGSLLLLPEEDVFENGTVRYVQCQACKTLNSVPKKMEAQQVAIYPL